MGISFYYNLQKLLEFPEDEMDLKLSSAGQKVLFEWNGNRSKISQKFF